MHQRSITRLSCVAGMLFALLAASDGYAQSAAPMEVLRDNIGRGVQVLKDPRYADASTREAQRERLCGIAREMFDVRLFAKLALGANWRRFSVTEQQTFVDTFAHYLCRYYLSRLQQRYTDENVALVEQTYRSPKLATVKVEVLWQQSRVPVEVRMALREGRWRAYDLVFMGVSAVMVYRTQFNDALASGTPAALIESLRTRSAEGD